MKRPWNLPNVPVYSLATYSEATVNMNICTYVTAVSMKPKQYIIAVYHDTLSLENMMNSNVAVLQFLSRKHHTSLINILGKKSGRSYNKKRYLDRKGILTLWKNKEVLSHSAALIELEKRWWKEAGDHTLFLFDVKSFVVHHEDVLTLDDLRARKLIRI
jgi:flavin reductase (DIM6/NTAB) family NADH-FMN oxidoreductase RutF